MPRQPPTPQTYASLVAHFTSLLTITVHTLLSARGLYPANTFLTARAYNIPVRQSRHPGVCSWINSAVAAVRTQLLKCTVAKVVFVIFEAEGKSRVLERWVWDVGRWPVVPGVEAETRLVREGENGETAANGLGNGAQGVGGKDDATAKYVVDMEEQFRALLARLSTLPARLQSLPADCTYTLCIELREPDMSLNSAQFSTPDVQPPIGHPQPWIPAQPSLQKTVQERGNERYGGDIKRRVHNGQDIGGRKTVPVRTVEAGEMRFEMWVEEGAAKFEALERKSLESSGESGGLRADNLTSEASSGGFAPSSGSSGENGRSSPFR